MRLLVGPPLPLPTPHHTAAAAPWAGWDWETSTSPSDARLRGRGRGRGRDQGRGLGPGEVGNIFHVPSGRSEVTTESPVQAARTPVREWVCMGVAWAGGEKGALSPAGAPSAGRDHEEKFIRTPRC